MDRRQRLTSPSEVQRVRSSGKSYAHPLAVLVTRRNDLDLSRFAVAAGRGAGGAVRRNRAKRRLRSTLRTLAPVISPGWDILLLAREATASAAWADLERAVAGLCRRAGLLTDHG
ncbi:MAG TPA: ribonuclease P protein component [Anaerolineales bacterium]|nr:ribonuclease P protein component [Anaerolineales bacterium]